MAALTFGLCAVIRELCDLADAFFRCGFSVHKSLSFLRARNRLKLFKKYCEAVWLQYEYENLAQIAIDNNSNQNLQQLIKAKMRRGRFPPNAGIDFAAMEATALGMEATDVYRAQNDEFEVVDGYGVVERVETPTDDFIGNYEDIEVVDGVEMDVSYYEYIDAHPQATKKIEVELREGTCFIVTGRILLTCERFSINFLMNNPTKDIALHINPRLPQNYVVRNTRVRNVWGREEIATQLPFNLHRGTEFSIQVLVTEKAFMISCNGYHFSDYTHRLPYKAIKSIEVKGDVEKVKIQRKECNAYPERQAHSTRKIRTTQLDTPFRSNSDGSIAEMAFYDTLIPAVIIPTQWRTTIPKRESDDEQLTMPYIGRLEKNSLIVGCALCITGRVKLLPHSFYINLQDGPNFWPHQNIAFHFNPRFSTRGSGTLGKAVVCRNAWYDGAWAKEERSELDTNLRPGKKFVIMIRCTDDAFIVYVDRKFVTSFKYQLEPSIVNTVYIRGDIKLVDVTLMTPTATGNDHEANITENPVYENDEFEFLDQSTIGSHIKAKGEEEHNEAAIM